MCFFLIQVNNILTAVVSGMRKDSDNDLRFAATNALYNALDFARVNFDTEQERTYLMQVNSTNNVMIFLLRKLFYIYNYILEKTYFQCVQSPGINFYIKIFKQLISFLFRDPCLEVMILFIRNNIISILKMRYWISIIIKSKDFGFYRIWNYIK